MRYKYEATDRLKEIPGWTKLNGKGVGIGGSVTVKRPAPDGDTLIKEATQKEYEELFNKGHKGVIRKKYASKKSNSRSTERSERSAGDDREV